MSSAALPPIPVYVEPDRPDGCSDADYFVVLNAARERYVRAVTELSDKRYAARAARMQADTSLDPRVRDRYLDRTLLDRAALVELMQAPSSDNLSGRASVRAGIRRPPGHPSGWIDPDGVKNWRFGKPQPLVERGRAVEYLVQLGLGVLDPETGKVSRQTPRVGSARVPRPRKTTTTTRNAVT